jgi:hypothetical protein
MEDDATRTPSPRSKSARPPAALFMEPTVPATRPAAEPATRPATPEPAPRPATPEPSGSANGAAPTPPEAPRKAAPRNAAPRKAAPRKATPAPNSEPAARKAAPRKATRTAAPEPATEKAAKTAKATKSADQPGKADHLGKAEQPGKADQPGKAAPPRKRAVAATAVKAGPARKATSKKTQPVVRAPWWTRTPLTPGAVPQLLAEAAVERFGDSVDRYLRWLQETYPQATPDGLARLATERLTRHLGYATLTGPAGAVALVPAQALLVLHIAAAYGRDPRDPQRVPELLALVEPRALAGPLLGQVAGRLLPGAGMVVGLLAGAGTLDRTARRAIAFYRKA